MKCDVDIRKELYAMSCCQVKLLLSARRRTAGVVPSTMKIKVLQREGVFPFFSNTNLRVVATESNVSLDIYQDF